MSHLAAAHCHNDTGTITATLTTGTSSSAISLGTDTLWALTCDGDLFFAVGTSAISAPTTASFPLWQKSYYTMLMGRNSTHIRIFNNTAGSVNYYLHPLVRK